MRRALKLFGLVVFSAFFMQQSVLAVGVNDTLCGQARKDFKNGRISEMPAVCQDDASRSNSNPLTGPEGLITRAVRVFAFVVGIAAVIGIIVSGLRFVLSSGDPSNTASARSGLLYSLVGLLFAAFAQAIVSLVLTNV